MAQTDNEFMKAYFGLMSDTLGSPSKSSIFMQTILPVWALGLMSKYSQRRSLVHARHTAKLADAVTRALVESKAGALLQGKNNKDILSLLGLANASENEATKLTEEEMLAQMRTILLAGHETSATTLCWVLLELARNLENQERLRAEIRATEMATGRKYSSFTASDLDGMEYLAAILKESMRFHPALYQNYRQAAKDDVLPLSTPIKTTSGEYISTLPIPKGMKVILSIAAYNRFVFMLCIFRAFLTKRYHIETRKFLEKMPTHSILRGGFERMMRRRDQHSVFMEICMFPSTTAVWSPDRPP
ncbi:hypothetical protein C0991_003305 [Blastosporella zonata]|nr:hypothetical protein C0991_003305 [Blastosporella zonata]